MNCIIPFPTDHTTPTSIFGAGSVDRSIRKDVSITFLASFVLIVYEVFLSRYFAAIMDYNFVFLSISLATLGIGLGGCLASKTGAVIYQNRNLWLGAYSLVLLTVVYLMYVLPFMNIWFYSAAALLPFGLGGALLAAIIQSQHQRIRLIYFGDLTGAGVGAASSIWLMNVINPIRTISVLSAALMMASFLFERNATNSRFKKVILTSMITFVIFNGIYSFSNAASFRAYVTSPHNIFKDEKDSKVVFSDWNSLSRTDVFDAGDGELLYMTIDGGAVSPISKYSGDFNQVDYLLKTTSSLAFQHLLKDRALIIGAGGGQEILTAQMANFKNIEAIDINPASFEAVKALSSFSGDILKHKGVNAVVADGRNYLRNTSHQYDLIYLSLVKKQSANGLGIALTENYIFTEEAIEEYVKKLKPGGRLAFLLHDEAELAKVLAASEKVLQIEGVSKMAIKNHIAIIGTIHHLGHDVRGLYGSKITRPLIMISKQPLSLENAVRLKSDADQIQQLPIHIPYVHDRIASVKNMLASEHVNVAMNRDDMPFFYSKSKGVPSAFIWIIITVFLICLFTIRMTNFGHGHATYFSGIALGFIIIETTLVQRLILPLGHPTVSFVIVLGVLLVSGGIGSLLSINRSFKPDKRYSPLLWVAILTIGLNIGITWYNNQSFYFPQPFRLIVAGLLLIPLGFFMGMPFPFGLSRTPKQWTALSWAINGLMTVAGSLSAVMISFNFGFSAAMMFGASMYGMLYLIQPGLNMQARS